LQKLVEKEQASLPFMFNVALEEGKLILFGVAKAPDNEIAKAANELFKDQDVD